MLLVPLRLAGLPPKEDKGLRCVHLESIVYLILANYLGLTEIYENAPVYLKLCCDFRMISSSMGSVIMYSAFLRGPASLIEFGLQGTV